MNRIVIVSLFLFALVSTDTFGQSKKQDSSFNRFFIGSSVFMIANALPNPPSFYQLNVGYWLSPKDVLSLEAITWTYDAPLGIPYGPSHGKEEEKYPGFIREHGIALAYQRYLWKKFYAAVHVAPFRQTYRSSEKEVIQKGFQLFMTFRLGYHFTFLNDRLFLEPSIAMTHWPINTNTPESFAKQDNKWPNRFLPEPGLHFGVKF
ncbi:MAG: hypothetical protein AAF587_25410 [Bacteroidota bacterium]